MITSDQVDMAQGELESGETFGYVAGDGGGYFFTHASDVYETIESVEVDEAGDGGLDIEEVRDFLRRLLTGSNNYLRFPGFDRLLRDGGAK